MTNHPKFTASHDSAARSAGYEGAREIRRDTIEECAAIADAMADETRVTERFMPLRNVAAAIRRLHGE